METQSQASFWHNNQTQRHLLATRLPEFYSMLHKSPDRSAECAVVSHDSVCMRCFVACSKDGLVRFVIIATRRAGRENRRLSSCIADHCFELPCSLFPLEIFKSQGRVGKSREAMRDTPGRSPKHQICRTTLSYHATSL